LLKVTVCRVGVSRVTFQERLQIGGHKKSGETIPHNMHPSIACSLTYMWQMRGSLIAFRMISFSVPFTFTHLCMFETTMQRERERQDTNTLLQCVLQTQVSHTVELIRLCYPSTVRKMHLPNTSKSMHTFSPCLTLFQLFILLTILYQLKKITASKEGKCDY
jgi:hypothetical protein